MSLTPLARYILDRTPGPVPRYGSPEWAALPEHDLRRVAAVVLAAECWRDHCSPERIAADLTAAMVEQECEIRRRVRESSWDVADGRDWAALSRVPTHAELVQRRAS